MSGKIRIYIVDDEIMAVNYLKSLLQEISPDYEVIGEEYNGQAALPQILELEPDIVFADIIMPIMDGLELADEIIRQNPGIKIILLTSYRDFDYVKKGIALGVSSYVLKNELSPELLSKEIEKQRVAMSNSKRKDRTYMEHNLRMFLNHQTGFEEDYIYTNKPLRRFAILYFFGVNPIRLAYREDKVYTFDAQEIEELGFPRGIRCRNFVNVASNIWCGIMFIEPEIPSGLPPLMFSAELIVNYLREKKIFVKCILPEPVKHFLQIPECYQKCRKYQKYVYAFAPDKYVFTCEEIQKNIGMPVDLNELRSEFEKALDDHNLKEAEEILRIWIIECAHSMNLYDYEQELRIIEAELRKYVEKNQVGVYLTELPKEYDSVSEIIQVFTGCLKKIMVEVENKAKKKYSACVENALSYISIHYPEDISLQQIADNAGVSEGYLRKIFKQELGETIITYLTSYRIERAKDLMRRGETRMKEICARTGFSYSQYFSYVFRKKEGVSPSDYLKKL